MKKNYFDPLTEIEGEIKARVLEKIKEIYGIELDPSKVKVETPPRKELGDLAVPVGFLLSEIMKLSGKERGKIIKEAPKKIAEKIDVEQTFFREIKPVGGFLNFFIDYTKLARFVLENILELGEDYGKINIGGGETVIVEHTSANPVHPLHIGTARNAILGDTLSRLIERAGYKVRRHFYINDMGKQVAYLVYGYSKLKDLKKEGKKDHWLGVIYSCVNVLSNVREREKKLPEIKKSITHIIKKIQEELGERNKDSLNYKLGSLIKKLEYLPTTDWRETIPTLKTLIEELKENHNKENKELMRIERELAEIQEWLEIESEIKAKWSWVYNELEKRTLDQDIEEEVSKLVKLYEEGDEETSKIFKEVCEIALQGFKETLNKINIEFDSFDWESNLMRKGKVKEILEKLKKLGWAKKEPESKALYLDIRNAIVEKESVAKLFNLTIEKAKELIEKEKTKELPPNLPLTRSDGTTLYTTRDIAYSVYKFTNWNAKKVYNVIGVDQTLAQKQLKAGLILSGYEEFAENQIHVAYELVTLPGRKFSSRRGRYITFDEVFEEAKVRAYEEIHKRWPEEEKEIKEKTAEKIAIGAIRYALIEVSPTKKITFQWDRVLDFEQNSGPFLQYAYVRAINILKKAENTNLNNIKFELLKEEEEKELIMKIAQLPKKIKEAINLTRPDILAEYANKLAQTFNKFYQKHRVLQAETEELKKARLALVKAYKITLGNTMEILGIPKLEKM